MGVKLGNIPPICVLAGLNGLDHPKVCPAVEKRKKEKVT